MKHICSTIKIQAEKRYATLMPSCTHARAMEGGGIIKKIGQGRAIVLFCHYIVCYLKRIGNEQDSIVIYFIVFISNIF